MEHLNLKGITSLRNLICLLILLPAIALAASFSDSVLIGGTGPANSKAELDVRSTTKGVLLPRMTTTQQNAITSPTEGLILYDNVLHQLSVYDGAAWQAMFDAGNLTGTIPPGSVPAATTGATGVVFASNATSHNFVTGITSGTGAVTVAQPAFTDISGTASASQLPNPSSSTLGGIRSAAAVSHQWINSISTSGIPALSQPAFSDVAGNISTSQMNSGTSASSATFWRGDGTWASAGAALPLTTLGDTLYEDATPTAARLAGNTTTTKKYLSQTGNGSISAAPAWAQIAFTDLSGSVAATQLPNPTATTLGGIESKASTASQWINSISTSGVPSSSQPAFSDISGTASLTTQVTGTLPIANGGTGQTAQTQAFDALSPLTTAGDTLVYASGHNARVGTVLGDLGKAWTSGGGTVPNGWSVLGVAGGGTGLATLTAHGLLVGNGTSTVSVTATGSAGQVLTSNGASADPTWQAAPAGTNFVTNYNAETDTSGWATYANTAQATPVTGTGGSPTVTWTRTTSSPLTGTGSFLFTKDAANRQGNGASYDFTIDSASQAKVMNIDFDYAVASGTFVAGSTGVDSDIEVYIYDITNAVLIQPSTYKLFSSTTSPSSHFNSSFQTASNSTSYRLIFHTVTTSTAAYTVKFDSVAVARSNYTYGTPITDWVSYTPTTSGFSSLSGTTVWSRRVGDTLEVKGRFTAGAVAASAGQVSLGYAGVSGNVSIDFTKVANGTIVGGAGCSSNASTTFFGSVALANSSTPTAMQFGVTTSATSPMSGFANASVLCTAAQSFGFYFSVPIIGWSSTVQMSDSAPQSGISFSGTNVSQALTANSTLLTLTSVKDSAGAFSVNTYTVTVPGDYVVTGSGQMSAAGTLYPFKNGATAVGSFSTASAANFISAGSVLLTGLVAGNTISIRCDSSVTVSNANISIYRLGGPVSIGATESVNGSYSDTAGSAVGVSLAAYTFATKARDSHAAYSAGTLTIPISGEYRFSASMITASVAYVSGSNLQIQIVRNGTMIGFGQLVSQASLTTTYGTSATVSYPCNAGDTIQIKVASSVATTANTTAGVNTFTWERVGN